MTTHGFESFVRAARSFGLRVALRPATEVGVDTGPLGAPLDPDLVDLYRNVTAGGEVGDVFVYNAEGGSDIVGVNLGARSAAAFGTASDIMTWADGVALNPARIPAGYARTAELDDVLDRMKAHRTQGLARLAALAGLE